MGSRALARRRNRALAASFCASRHRSQSHPSSQRVRVPGYLRSASSALRIGLIADLVQLSHVHSGSVISPKTAIAGQLAASHCIRQPLGVSK